MNISKNEAQESLAQIESVVPQTRRAIAQGMTSKMPVLWGIIWLPGYSGTQFRVNWS